MTRLKNLLFEQESDISSDLWNSIFRCYFIQMENCYYSPNPSIFYQILIEWIDVFQIQKRVLPSSSYYSLYPDSTIDDKGKISIFIGVMSYSLVNYNSNKDPLEKEFWSCVINEEMEKVVIHYHSMPVLSEMLVIIRSFYHSINHSINHLIIQSFTPIQNTFNHSPIPI